jgi:CRISPR-associated protein Csx14
VRLDGELKGGDATEASLVIDYWGDHLLTTRRDPLKLWGGAGGYPGAALARDALELTRDADARGPFDFSAAQSSAFRLDWRRDYIPLDAGFSPNKQSDVKMVGYPLVELLAAIGLSFARPRRHDRLAYTYGVIGGRRYAPSFMRAAFGGAELPFPRRSFEMQLGWTGQEGKERCITIVTEDKRR